MGRDAELERIDQALGARDKLPSGLLLLGRPGIGKTVLWSEAGRRARAAGYRVLECALSQNESRLAYAGLADLIRPVIDEVLPDLTGPQARALRAALTLTGEAGATDERGVAFGLHAALSALAQGSPLAVCIDDLQWLDPSSSLMLSYAIRRLRRDPVLLILAQRVDDSSDAEAPRLDLAGYELERLEVGPLSLGAIHRVVQTRLGAELTRPQILRVHAASGGNPLHAMELARALDPAGAVTPDTLSALIAHRIAALPERTRVALALSAMSTDPDVDALSDLLGTPLGPELQDAIDTNLVTITADRVRFAHPLNASIAESSVSAAQCRELHRALARATTGDVRALHIAQATRSPHRGVAETVERSALAARRRGARATSAELFEAAARLTPPREASSRARRLLAAAENWYEAGDATRPRHILEALLLDLGPGDQRAEASWRLGILHDEAGRWQEATALWQDALGMTDDPGLTSSLLCSLAITAFYTTSVEEAAAHATEAVAWAERSPDRAHLARSLAVQALTMVMGGTAGHEQVLARALAVEPELEGSLGDWSPSGIAAECARHTGDVAGARPHYTTVLARAVASGDANLEQWAAFGLAWTEVLAGNYQRASELADTVLALADQTAQMRIPARSLRAQVDASLGRLAAARTWITEARDAAIAASEATHLFGCQVVLGHIETCAGDAAAAARAFEAARHIASEIGLSHATALRAYLCESEAAAAVGRLEQARTAQAAFVAAVEGTAPGWSVPLVHRAQASALVASGHLHEAQGELAEALSGDSESPDRARALLMLGSVRRRLREYGQARVALGEASRIFTELGSPPWIERAAAELARIPGRRMGGGRSLTETEARIARLVATGRSNRQVAQELFVSVKTIEAALTRVYEKTGVRSRAELAASSSSAPWRTDARSPKE